jgi:hypothetical protein
MMGSRGPKNGIECDAFSRRSRCMLVWQPGEIRRAKRAFAKRVRKAARREIVDRLGEELPHAKSSRAPSCACHPYLRTFGVVEQS